jgi:GNAT superfamily N-acetyltransferase
VSDQRSDRTRPAETQGSARVSGDETSDRPPTEDRVEISTDASRIDRDLVHRFLSEESYWAKGVPSSVLDRAIEHSLVFAVLQGQATIGFARVVTDRATFAWLCDVFVVPERRGIGIGSRLMRSIVEHPDLRGLRRFVLATRDAHVFYARFGFQGLDARSASALMEIWHSADDVYR